MLKEEIKWGGRKEKRKGGRKKEINFDMGTNEQRSPYNCYFTDVCSYVIIYIFFFQNKRSRREC